MSHLPGLLLTLCSLIASSALAAPPSERQLRARTLSPSTEPLAVRVAPGVPTTLNFEADIDPRSVALEPSERVRLLNVGERALTLEPLREVDAPITLRVRYADPALSPQPVFTLSEHPTEVDAQLKVTRSPSVPHTRVAELEARLAACEAARASRQGQGGTSGPVDLALSGYLGNHGVTVSKPRCAAATHPGEVWCGNAAEHRTRGWAVVAFDVHNPSGQPEWRPGAAWLVGESTQQRLQARVLAMRPQVLRAGETGRLALEFSLPKGLNEDDVQLEVREAGGARHLLITDVLLKARLE